MIRVFGAVLAGGASRRMGQPKALIEVDGVAMARRAADALLAGGAARVVLVGSPPAEGAALGLDVIEDQWPGEGPLVGLATAIEALVSHDRDESAIVVVAACDQPDLDGAMIARLVEALHGAPPEVVASAVSTPDGRRHPLPSAWRGSVTPSLRVLLQAGERRVAAAFTIGSVVEIAGVDADVADLDTPDDLARWRSDG